MFNELGTERTFNVIDDILVEAELTNASTGDALLKVRTAYRKAYEARDDDDPADEFNHSEFEYAEQTEDGYLGLPIAPLN